MTIKEIRRMRNMTQQELADAIGVSLAVVSRYESGKITPPAYRIQSIAKALDVSADIVLGSISQDSLDGFSSDGVYYPSDTFQVARSRVSKYVHACAGGFCELCGQPAPFRDKQGIPYLEMHFVTPLSKGGRCDIWNAVALCPNCHKRVQILQDQDDLVRLASIAENHR